MNFADVSWFDLCVLLHVVILLYKSRNIVVVISHIIFHITQVLRSNKPLESVRRSLAIPRGRLLMQIAFRRSYLNHGIERNVSTLS